MSDVTNESVAGFAAGQTRKPAIPDSELIHRAFGSRLVGTSRRYPSNTHGRAVRAILYVVGESGLGYSSLEDALTVGDFRRWYAEHGRSALLRTPNLGKKTVALIIETLSLSEPCCPHCGRPMEPETTSPWR